MAMNVLKFSRQAGAQASSTYGVIVNPPEAALKATIKPSSTNPLHKGGPRSSVKSKTSQHKVLPYLVNRPCIIKTSA